MADYWIKASGKVHGPFNSRELKKLIANGKLKESHELSPDRKIWKSAGKVGGLTFPDGKEAVTPTNPAAAGEQVAKQSLEVSDDDSASSTTSEETIGRSWWLSTQHFLGQNPIPVAVALLLCLAVVHYLVISPWLHFSKVLSAAEEGNVYAHMEVALLYETGAGTWQSYSDAIKWYAAAAEKGNMNAIFLLYGAVAAKRTGDEKQIVLTSISKTDQLKELMERNPLMGLVMTLSEAHQNGNADKPMAEVDFDTFDRGSETKGGIRDYKVDPLASAFLTRQAESGSAIAAMQIANVARIKGEDSETATPNTVNAELLVFLSDASNASGFSPDSAGPHAFKVLSDIAAQIDQTDGQE